MAGLAVAVHGALVILARNGQAPADGMSPATLPLVLAALFLFSIGVSIVAVLSGIGGGVIYTPLLLAFTPMNSVIVRATGLVAAFFSGLVSGRALLHQGVASLKVAVLCNLGYCVGGLLGAGAAVHLAAMTGPAGEGWIRIALGALVAFLATYFAFGGVKREWPNPEQPTGWAARLRLAHVYFEPSLGREVFCAPRRPGVGVILMALVGIMAGFFGLGGGWAIVPVLNLVMDLPLKMATATGNVILGMGGPLTLAPYWARGAILPLWVAPLVVGHVVGGLLGARVLVRVRSATVRTILIGVLFYASFGLITNGLHRLHRLPALPPAAHGVALLAVASGVARALRSRDRSCPS